MKRILALLLCFCLCVSLIPAASAEDTDEIIVLDEEFLTSDEDELIDVIDPEAAAPFADDKQSGSVVASGFCGRTEDDSVTWTLYDNGELYIDGSGEMEDYLFEPAPWKAYDNSSDGVPIRRVIIGDDVEAIGAYAFTDMEWLTAVHIGASLQAIGIDSFNDSYRNAFANCDELTGFNVSPDNLFFTAIEGVLFSIDGETLLAFPSGMVKYTNSYEVPYGTVAIAPCAFMGSRYLYDLELPPTLETIGNYAFMGCERLRSLEMRHGITELPRGMCKDCTYLTDFWVPGSVTSICYVAFENCRSLHEIWLPDGLETLEACAFKGSGLDMIELPDSLTELPTQLFMECPWLHTVILGSNIQTVGDWVFDGCEELERVIFTGSAPDMIPYKNAAPAKGSFLNASFTALYPAEDASWTSEVCSTDYGGNVTWQPYTDGLFIKKQPVTQLVYEGWTAEFNVRIRCAAVTVYEWQYKTPDALSGPWQDVPDAWEDGGVLLIPTTLDLNGSLFRCKITSLNTTIFSDEANLIVKSFNLPVIVNEPESQSVNVGETATFSVTAEGENLKYEWQYLPKGSAEWKQSSGTAATTPNLPVLVKAYRDGYQYRCKVYNVSGAVYTVPASLTALGSVQITGQPQSVTVKEDATAKFTVTASGLAPLSYQWQVSTNGKGDDWTDSTLSGAKTATLSVKAYSYRSGYQYRCRVGNVGGDVYTMPATLTVLTAPVITAQPKSISAANGDGVTFSVKATGVGLSYQWQYRTSSTGEWKDSSGSDAKKADYPILALSYRSGYQYRCKVSNAAGSVVSNAATLTVSPAQMPAIKTQPKSVSTFAGDTAVFSVTATGGGLSYQWQYRTSSSGAWNNCGGADAKTAQISVEAKSYRNGYQYRVIVTNTKGSVSSNAATLTVKAYAKPTITTQPKSVTANPGVTVSFTVAASGSGTLSYQWYFRTSSAGEWTKCTGGTGKTLNVEAKSYRSGYQYRCGVTNAGGTTYSNAATLTVASVAKPTITTQPKSVTVPSGSTAVFSVTASGSGALSYQWYFRTSSAGEWTKCSGGSSSMLSVEGKSYRSGYQYRCGVTNEGGTTFSSAATLTVTASNLALGAIG